MKAVQSARKSKLDSARAYIGQELACALFNAILDSDYHIYGVISVNRVGRPARTLADRNREAQLKRRQIGFSGIPNLFEYTENPAMLKYSAQAAERSKTMQIMVEYVLSFVRKKFPDVLVEKDTRTERLPHMTLDNQRYIDHQAIGHADNTAVIAMAELMAQQSQLSRPTVNVQRPDLHFTVFSESTNIDMDAFQNIRERLGL